MSSDTYARTAGQASVGAPGHTGERRLGVALLVISMAQLMLVLVLDELIVNTVLPHVQRALHFSGTGLEWVVTSYAVTFGGLLLLGGRSGDILGLRRMFVIGLAWFSLASLLGGLATTSWLLITARTLQGVGAAITAPAALSLTPITIGAALAPVGMFWLSRVQEGGHYLTTVALPEMVFAACAGMIFVPLTMTLVAGISEEHAGIASSMFNAGQQVGGAVGLAVIGTVSWTVFSHHIRTSLHAQASTAGPAAPRDPPVGQPAIRPRPDQWRQGSSRHWSGCLRRGARRRPAADPGTEGGPP